VNYVSKVAANSIVLSKWDTAAWHAYALFWGTWQPRCNQAVTFELNIFVMKVFNVVIIKNPQRTTYVKERKEKSVGSIGLQSDFVRQNFISPFTECRHY
jgi:hypothetical protein